MRAFFKTMFERIADAVFVDKYNCAVCGRELKGGGDASRYALCELCSSKLIYIRYPCKKCGKPLNNQTDYCLMCENHTRHFTRAYSAFEYWGEIENLIYALKFGGKRYLAKYLSAHLADKFFEEGIVADCIAAIPLHETREKQRGYNQAGLLAKSLAKRLNLPLKSGLERVKVTEMQAKTSGRMRIKNVEDAFLAIENCKGQRVLLIDDVLTTGATMSEAAKALKKAGALEVIGLTLANVRDKLIKAESSSL